jgi:signal transduction histidine kinase/ligand-binding sensor domain-containing protein
MALGRGRRRVSPASWLVVPCALAPLLVAPVARALDPARRLDEYTGTFFRLDDGLPHLTVSAIAQSDDGYLWLRTGAGLARFDGRTFTTVELPGVTAMTRAAAGGLWIGTDQGLWRWRAGALEAAALPGVPRGERVHAVLEDADGSLWISVGSKVVIQSGASLRTYEPPAGRPAPDVLLRDRSGAVWLGRGGWLTTLARGAPQPHPLHEAMTGGLSLESMALDRRGRLLVGTDQGLLRSDGTSVQRFLPGRDLPGRRVDSLFADRDGGVWISTGNGLTRFLPDDRIETLDGGRLGRFEPMSYFEDREGTLWVGTREHGLLRLTDRAARRVALPTGGSVPLLDVMIARDGAVWLATAEQGVVRWAGDRDVARFTTAEGLGANFVWALAEDGAGRVWAGTGKGLHWIEPPGKEAAIGSGRSVQSVRDPRLEQDVLVKRLFFDRRGTLWVGTKRHGLARLRGGELTFIGDATGPSRDDVVVMAEDERGAIWVALARRGLARVDGDRLSRFTTAHGLPTDHVVALHAAADGALYAGTQNRGLVRIAGGQVSVFDRRHGLPSDAVVGIAEDAAGFLWLATGRGLARLAPGQLARDPRQVAREGRLQIAVVEHGAEGAPLAWDSHIKIDRGPGGALWIASGTNIHEVDPRRVVINDVPPRVTIEGIVVDGDLVPFPRDAAFGPGVAGFEVGYVAPTSVQPHRMVYQYRLAGFDRAWVDAGDRRAASYGNVPPGTYRFEVRAINSDGIAGGAEAAVRLVLRPRFHQTRLFAIACVLTVAAAAFAAYRLRLRRLRAQHQAVLAERNRVARELHDSLLQGMAALTVQLQVLEQKAPPKSELGAQVRLLEEIVAESVGAARRSIWGLRDHEATQGELGAALSRAARLLTSGTPIETRVQVQGAARDLSPAVAQELLRIAQEAITNAVKHARPRSISVTVRFDPDRVAVVVQDDGVGFDVAPATSARSGFGLLGMQERAAAVGGTVRVESTPGHGTTIEAVVVHAARGGGQAA